MPRTEEANQRIREAQRAKILVGARKVFARKGLGTTMADVATAAGVSQGLAYRYFKSKEDLLLALFEENLHASEIGFQRLREIPGTPLEHLTFLISRIVESRRDYPEVYQLLYPELTGITAPSNLRGLIEQQGQMFIDTLRRLIVEGQALGEIIQDDPDQLVAAMMAYLDGLTRLALYDAERLRKQFPDPKIILRIFNPAAGQPGGPVQSTGKG